MKKTIFSRCIYDVEHRYVDMYVKTSTSPQGHLFVITMEDTSVFEDADVKVELVLNKDELQTIVDRLTAVIKE